MPKAFAVGFEKVANPIVVVTKVAKARPAAAFGRGFEKVAVSKNWKAMRMANGEIQRRLGIGLREYQDSGAAGLFRKTVGRSIRHHQDRMGRLGRFDRSQLRTNLRNDRLAVKSQATNKDMQATFKKHQARNPSSAPKQTPPPSQDFGTRHSEHVSAPTEDVITSSSLEQSAPSTSRADTAAPASGRSIHKGLYVGGGLAAAGGVGYGIHRYRKNRVEQPAQVDNNDTRAARQQKRLRSASSHSPE